MSTTFLKSEPLSEKEAAAYSPNVLAFYGDSVYETLVRENIVRNHRFNHRCFVQQNKSRDNQRNVQQKYQRADAYPPEIRENYRNSRHAARRDIVRGDENMHSERINRRG